MMLKLTSPPVQETVGVPDAVPRTWWCQPGFFVVAPVAASLLAWTLLVVADDLGDGSSTQEELSGFSRPADASLGGIVLLLTWNVIVILVATLGWRIGSRPRPKSTLAARTSTRSFERWYFLMMLAVAAIGVGYCYYIISASYSIIDSLANQSGNDFTKSLSQTAGPQTLRYATILAAPLGIHLWRKRVIGLPFMVAAVTLLLMNSLIAHRLSLLMASFVYVIIWAKDRATAPPKQGKPQPRRWLMLILIAVIGFSTLTALNYFRNATYYRALGVDNPVAMNLYQMGAYLAVPGQVSVGVSDAVMEGSWVNWGDPVTALNAVQPTFLQFEKVSKDDSWKGPEFYGYSVSFAANFFTNSVFADVYASFGLWGWVYTFALYGFAGFLFARLLRYSTVISASAGVIAYCFSEVWRIQIVSYGFVIFLMMLTVGGTIAALWLSKRINI